LIFAALLLTATTAAAQSERSITPFKDEPVSLAQAAALERIEATAQAHAAVRPAARYAKADAGKRTADEQDEAEDERSPMADLALLGGSLSAASPKLARALTAALEEMAEAAEAGKNAARPAKKVVDLSGKARAAILKSKPVDTPALQAALMASLLLDDGGVSESYEGAAKGDRTAYATGYFLLQRVKALWKGLTDHATPKQAEDVRQMLAMLDRLFPSQEPPLRLSPDPEEAEAPSQQLVTLLETVAKADLYPGRDLADAGVLVHELAQLGCKSLASRNRAVGAEELLIAANYYGRTMKNTVAVMAPDSARAIAAAFKSVQNQKSGDRVRACDPLLRAIVEGNVALTP